MDLKKAKDLAESSSHAKSLFLAQTGHELRTPLNAVLGFSDVLQNEVFGPLGGDKYREYARHINQSGTQLLTVIDNILEFTKCGTGALELSECRVAVGAVMERVVRQAAPIAESAGIAAEHVPKLREPFGQADCDLNRQYDGIGLGLPLAASRAKLHGARLTAESEVGLGTMATLTFPRNRVYGDWTMPPAPKDRLSVVVG